MIDFAAWCFKEKRKLAAKQYYHRIQVHIEVASTSPLVKCALRGIERLHVAQGTRSRARLPTTWKMLLDGESHMALFEPGLFHTYTIR